MHSIISLILLGSTSLAMAGTVNTATINPTLGPTMTSCGGYTTRNFTLGFPVRSTGAPAPINSMFAVTTLSSSTIGQGTTTRVVMNQPSDCAIDSAIDIAFTMEYITSVVGSVNKTTCSEARIYARTTDASSVTTMTDCTQRADMEKTFNCGITVQQGSEFEHSGYRASADSPIIFMGLATPEGTSASPTPTPTPSPSHPASASPSATRTPSALISAISSAISSKGNFTDGDKPGSAPALNGLFLPGAIVAAAVALIGAVML